MKHFLLTTIAAVLVVGCGPKAPDISIHDAAIDGDIEAVKQHLADGVDVNSKSDVGRTPLDVAIAFKQSLITDLLRKHDGKTRDELKAAESIWNAIEVGSIEATKQHIAKGADVNAGDDDGWTPLHEAALNGHKGIAELLIEKGANLNAKDRGRVPAEDTGKTPLHLAAKKGHNEVAELLIAEGADVNAKSESGISKGETPLDTAISRKHPETVVLLRKHGGKTGEELKAE